MLASVTLSDADKEGFASHASLLFAVPFLLFSTVGGWMADRFSKRSVMIGVKLGGDRASCCSPRWPWQLEMQSLQLAAICLMGVHSTIFAPAKYGIMPEVLPVSKLSAGNGILELLTFVGIILGTFAGGWLAETLVHREVLVRSAAGRARGRRLHDQPRHRQGARRRSRQEIQLQHPRRNLEQPARHEGRPRPLARQLGQHRVLLRRHAGADQSRAVRPEGLPPETHRTGLAPGRAEPRHRRGQHAGGQAFARPHRIRIDPAGRRADGAGRRSWLGWPGIGKTGVHRRAWRC